MELFDIPQMEARLSEVEAEAHSLRRLIQAAKEYEDFTGKLVFKSGNVTMREGKRGVGRAAPMMRATEQAVDIALGIRGAPMGISELVGILKNDPDLGMDAPNAANILSARLSNGSRFKGRRGQGWWYADRPWPGEELLLEQEGEKKPPE